MLANFRECDHSIHMLFYYNINMFAGITYLSGENFLDVLDNGVELCQLAAVIHDKAREALDQGLIVGVSATLPIISSLFLCFHYLLFHFTVATRLNVLELVTLILILLTNFYLCWQSVPHIRGRCWQRAARRSFFSRDNTENFITFCRDLGVHENLLFESDDLGKFKHHL